MADPIFTIAQRLKPTFARIGGISEADADAVVRRSDRADAQANGSLALAKQLGKTPREIAQLVLDDADLSSVCSSVEIAGPGSVDRVTINKTATECEVIYDATLTVNWVIAGMNLVLGKVFNKIGDTATSDLREVLAWL